MATPCGQFGVGAVALLLAHFISNGHFTHVRLVGGVFNGVHTLVIGGGVSSREREKSNGPEYFFLNVQRYRDHKVKCRHVDMTSRHLPRNKNKKGKKTNDGIGRQNLYND